MRLAAGTIVMATPMPPERGRVAAGIILVLAALAAWAILLPRLGESGLRLEHLPGKPRRQACVDLAYRNPITGRIEHPRGECPNER